MFGTDKLPRITFTLTAKDPPTDVDPESHQEILLLHPRPTRRVRELDLISKVAKAGSSLLYLSN